MTTLVNGVKRSQVSTYDRGLLYGQTVFETIAVSNQQPLLLDSHLRRLKHGADALGIPLDDELEQRIRVEISSLCRDRPKSVLRLTLTMGEGGRGYLNPQPAHPTRVLSIHPYPEYPSRNWHTGIELGLVAIRLATQPALAGIKHGNRLEQTIARSQWQSHWQEALVMNQQGGVVEGTQSNVFALVGDQLLTPELSQCGVAGVMREYLLSCAETIGVGTQTVPLSVSDIESADAVFVSNSLIGVWPVKRFQDTRYKDFAVTHKLLKLLLENEVIPNY